MYGSALLKTIDDTGVAVLTLTEGIEDAELLASRLTRAEVTRQLRLFTEAAIALPDELSQSMPEVDWPGIGAAGVALAGPIGQEMDEAIVMATRALIPTTLMWMRVYKQQHPEWFSMSLA
jgi:hypothetical protein